MKIETHEKNSHTLAEIISDEVLITNPETAANLLADLYYQGFDGIIIEERNITPAFFDLKNGIAGEILQKFSNFRVRLAIVGDFTAYTGKSITDFIRESNNRKQINFLSSKTTAIEVLSK